MPFTCTGLGIFEGIPTVRGGISSSPAETTREILLKHQLLHEPSVELWAESTTRSMFSLTPPAANRSLESGCSKLDFYNLYYRVFSSLQKRQAVGLGGASFGCL
jgi:hypothetical protein